ncbi:hypothetical protein K440DRAFT_686649, partial [Wilcoxina mikolae CBS 423.85]
EGTKLLQKTGGWHGHLWGPPRPRAQALPEGKEQVKQALLEEWDRITPEDILKYVNSMPQRIKAVLEADGGHTRW